MFVKTSPDYFPLQFQYLDFTFILKTEKEDVFSDVVYAGENMVKRPYLEYSSG